MEITIVQIVLGIILFFIVNWIGKHSYSIGYMGISMFTKAEESPGLKLFNKGFNTSSLYHFNFYIFIFYRFRQIC